MNYKFEEWADKNINVAIRHKYLYEPESKTVYVAAVSRRGFNGRGITEEDYKDTWLEAYKDAEIKVSKLTI